MNVLVTGGAGYIGSHMVHELLQAGFSPIVLDNLSTGHTLAIPEQVEFVQADIRDRHVVQNLLISKNIRSVFHFAARIQVGESVTNPCLYYRDNLSATLDFFETAIDCGVAHMIFSSTAAVYGDPTHIPIDEEHTTKPVNPYGETKLAVERALIHYERAYGLQSVALRYFNAAGANANAGLGERHEPETHLIPLVIEAVLGRRSHITIFGNDYDTPDGTCIRDYIHVRDLVQAHLAALRYLEHGGSSCAINLGTGQGYSVKEVIEAVEHMSNQKVPVQIGPRRAGDPPILVASAEKAQRLLDWKAQRSSLHEIVEDAWKFHKHM